MNSEDHFGVLQEAAARRLSAARAEREALDYLNALVRDARSGGMAVVDIAEAIGTTRQRVYEILREG